MEESQRVAKVGLAWCFSQLRPPLGKEGLLRTILHTEKWRLECAPKGLMLTPLSLFWHNVAHWLGPMLARPALLSPVRETGTWCGSCRELHLPVSSITPVTKWPCG